MASEVHIVGAEGELIQGTTSAGLASIFPAVPSPGNCGLPGFASALFAMLGAEAGPEPMATSPGAGPVVSSGIPTRAVTPDPPLKGTGPEHPDEKKKQDFGQDSVPVAVVVPLPVPIPQQVRVDSTAPKVAMPSQSTLQPLGSPDPAMTQPASGVVSGVTPSAPLPSAAGHTLVALRPLVPGVHQGEEQVRVDSAAPEVAPSDHSTLQPLGGDPEITQHASAPVSGPTGNHQQLEDEQKLHARRGQLSEAHAAENDAPAQASALRTQLERAVESLKAEAAQPAVPDSRDPAKNDSGVGADAPSIAPVAVASSNIQLDFAPRQAPDQAARSASIKPTGIPASLLSKSAFEQAPGGSGQNSTTGKSQQPAGALAADRHSGKEGADRTTGPAEPKPEAPSGDAVKAIDQFGAADTPPGKAQSEQGGLGALPPQAPRAEVVAQSDATDPGPKTDASSPPVAQSAAANSSPLHAERPPEPLFSSAQLIEKVSQSELRLGMRTGEFGSVEIRTTFDHQQLRAEISSERGELGQALSAELPGFEQRLREHDVPLSTVVVHQANAGGGGFDRPPRQQQPAPAALNVSEASDAKSAATAPLPEAWEPEGILDVRI
jgi:hypothetical protein